MDSGKEIVLVLQNRRHPVDYGMQTAEWSLVAKS